MCLFFLIDDASIFFVYYLVLNAFRVAVDEHNAG